ncbi:hypothetical protein L1987_50229 [Smallanthus sonchifolius]|uniref:Uncharacterized protein n=1 Tax=Smallanthus sonchifolius TaxID=185202 RepID=A0ACB9ELX3_9ASTR|nr:hypothetical protein L1987_50229 [Smallanthus sonchifolius]
MKSRSLTNPSLRYILSNHLNILPPEPPPLLLHNSAVLLRRHHKRKRKAAHSLISGMEDKLSILPLEIRSKVLSFLPTVSTVRTCVLSREWEKSWKLIRTIRLDDEGLNDFERMSSFNEHVMEALGAIRLEEFHLHVSHSLLAPPMTLIHSALSRHITELDLAVHSLELPPVFFTCGTLKKLKLRFSRWVPALWEQLTWDPELEIYLPGLEKFDTSAHHDVFQNVVRVINNSPALKAVTYDGFGYVPWIARVERSLNMRCLEFKEPVDHGLSAIFQVLISDGNALVRVKGV